MNLENRRRLFDLVVWIGSLVLAGGLLAGEALADGKRTVPDNPLYRAECGACHVAFPPSLLPAEAWRAQMASLPRHYGTDASLDPKAANAIAAYLEQHAGRDRGTVVTATEPPRITTSAWFLKEHRKVSPSGWTSISVKSASNCGACHAGAAQGDFDERSVRIPN